MSIIHDALRRKEGRADEPGRAESGASAAAADTRKSPQLAPAILAATGVFAAAFLTYLLTRPSSITVIVPPQESTGAPSAVTAPPAAPAPPDLVAFDPLREELVPYVPTPGMPAEAPSRFTPSPATAPMEPTAPPASDPSIPAEPPFGVPVYAGARLQANDADLPPDAVTIEMSEAVLESMNGGVTVNGAPAQPGARIQVGSEIRTAPGAAASIGFTRASVEIAPGSAGKVMRLERRSSAAGAAAEDVTLHLSSGGVRTIVRPGGGSVLVSTDPLTASTASGAFQIIREPGGDIRVRNEGGSVRLTPTARPNEAIYINAGEEVVYRDGAWMRRPPTP